MKIVDLLDILDGSIINQGESDEVFHATMFAKKVIEGGLFFCLDIDEINEALNNGASVIVYDSDELEFAIEKRVTTIRVKSIKESALRLLSYMVGDDEDIYFYLVKPHVKSFLKMVETSRREIEYLDDDFKSSFETILNSKKAIFVSTNMDILKSIKPDIKYYTKSLSGYNIEDTLFRSTFRVEKFVYQHKKMAPFHLEYLLTALSICKEHDLPYSIDRVDYTKHFRPIFIDEESFIQKGEIDDHVVIVSDSLEDINEGRLYAKSAKVTISKSILFTPPNVKVENYQYPTIFYDSDSLVDAIKRTSFNFGFVYSDRDEDYKALKEYFDNLRDAKNSL